ncbi:MAG: hypothetical protein C0622_07340 [Desulfuromonas sp.]|nr:MAG: hypothetical protein C0622_07340 [Desulfuromonas sp.]
MKIELLKEFIRRIWNAGDVEGATVYYFAGDRITGHWQIADRLSIFQQLRQASAGRNKDK